MAVDGDEGELGNGEVAVCDGTDLSRDYPGLTRLRRFLIDPSRTLTSAAITAVTTGRMAAVTAPGLEF